MNNPHVDQGGRRTASLPSLSQCEKAAMTHQKNEKSAKTHYITLTYGGSLHPTHNAQKEFEGGVYHRSPQLNALDLLHEEVGLGREG